MDFTKDILTLNGIRVIEWENAETRFHKPGVQDSYFERIFKVLLEDDRELFVDNVPDCAYSHVSQNGIVPHMKLHAEVTETPKVTTPRIAQAVPARITKTASPRTAKVEFAPLSSSEDMAKMSVGDMLTRARKAGLYLTELNSAKIELAQKDRELNDLRPRVAIAEQKLRTFQSALKGLSD
ncbi:hypothetical protein [Streptomyces sp. NBC_01304]|uniref:hypothetical protein n=1 Tax=Streptomyces sp. NBC_01304 TaxID=2903818 RepID=UPI002E13B6F7|nr:hypothetical protein OG430_48560 [Streptomyces sp. NBC_01304]